MKMNKFELFSKRVVTAATCIIIVCFFSTSTLFAIPNIAVKLPPFKHYSTHSACCHQSFVAFPRLSALDTVDNLVCSDPNEVGMDNRNYGNSFSDTVRTIFSSDEKVEQNWEGKEYDYNNSASIYYIRAKYGFAWDISDFHYYSLSLSWETRVNRGLTAGAGIGIQREKYEGIARYNLPVGISAVHKFYRFKEDNMAFTLSGQIGSFINTIRPYSIFEIATGRFLNGFWLQIGGGFMLNTSKNSGLHLEIGFMLDRLQIRPFSNPIWQDNNGLERPYFQLSYFF
jgi:hypothetical protein